LSETFKYINIFTLFIFNKKAKGEMDMEDFKLIKVSGKTWLKLQQIKIKNNFKNLDMVICSVMDGTYPEKKIKVSEVKD
jgi:hypothetical protein